MKKVVFGITSLSIGGAERVLVDIVNELSKDEEMDISIFTLYGKGEFEKQLSKNVKLISLYNNSYNEMSKLKKKLITLRLLFLKNHIYNKYIKDKFDVEVAFLEGPITRLFSVGKSNKIAWVHTDITKIFGNSFKSKVKKWYDSKIYSKYRKIIFASRENVNQFKTAYPSIDDNKLEIINNYINKDLVIEKANEKMNIEYNKETLNIVSISRLVKEKAIDRLIKVHKRLIQDNLQHNIYVVGDGVEKDNLQNLIKQEGVEDTFHLLGKRENPYPYIKNADMICLLSHYEGYPISIIESKLLQKYIVITNTSAKEAVENYDRSSVLENNEDDIYNGLKNIIKNKDQFINKNSNTEYDNMNILEMIKEIL